jgi:hypothetical protein
VWVQPKNRGNSSVLAPSPDFFSPSEFSIKDRSQTLLSCLRSTYPVHWEETIHDPDRNLMPPLRMTSRGLHMHLSLIKITEETKYHGGIYLAPVCWLPHGVLVLKTLAKPWQLLLCIPLQSASLSGGVFERYGGHIQTTDCLEEPNSLLYTNCQTRKTRRKYYMLKFPSKQGTSIDLASEEPTSASD